MRRTKIRDMAPRPAALRLTAWTLTICAALAGCSSDDDTDRSARSAFAGPGFKGAGTSAAGESIGAGLETAHCGTFEGLPFSEGPAPGEEVKILCFYGDPEAPPAASIEWVVETAADSQLVHVRLTLDPDFVDNSYGETAIGWSESKKKGHKFKDLVGSDHAEMRLTDAAGNTALHFKLDYISEVDGAPSGYASLGVSGGDGKMIEGDASDVVQVSTSLDRNLNACGLDAYTESSPISDEDFSPSPEAGEWDFRVVYDVWVKRSAFGAAGFGEALIDHVHASPSKADGNTIDVTPGDCPPTWGYCTDPDGCNGMGEPPGDPLEPCEMLDAFCGDRSPPPTTGTPIIDCEAHPEDCEGPM